MLITESTVEDAALSRLAALRDALLLKLLSGEARLPAEALAQAGVSAVAEAKADKKTAAR